MTIPKRKPRYLLFVLMITFWLSLSSLNVWLLTGFWTGFVQDSTLPPAGHGWVIMAALTGILLFTLFIYLRMAVLASLAIRKSADPRATLTITPDGVNDQLTPLSVGLISWDELTDVRIISLWTGGRVLLIDVKHPQRFIAGQSMWIRRMMRGFALKYGSPVMIVQRKIVMDLTELKEHILAARPNQP